MTTDKKIIGLHSLVNLIRSSKFDPRRIQKQIPSFYVSGSINEKYVEPNFTIEIGKITETEKPKVILVSAAGATGKSELTNFLSSALQIPVFDLAQHNPVASNSLTGLFFETLGAKGLADYFKDLTNGDNNLIIDALDEGHLKTTVDGFNAFLDNIAEVAKDAEGVPFILLGRNQVIEHTWLYLSEKQIECSLLHIEPFTTVQAREFIDKQIGETRYQKPYQLVRDFIIESVEFLFKSTSDINNKKQFQSFIGYAPVLQSIAILLNRTNDFNALLEELKTRDDRGIDLIITIVEHILIRDKNMKVRPLFLDKILADRPKVFAEQINEKAYSIEEQCARILFQELAIPADFKISEDDFFNKQYEEKIGEWVKEHPFIQGGKIQNVVFECYIIARLMVNEDFTPQVIEYLNRKYKDAFMLFFIYEKLSSQKRILPQFLPFLYSSIKSLDDSKSHTITTIESEIENGEDQSQRLTVEFTNSADAGIKYDFNVHVQDKEDICFSPNLSDLHIDAPIGIILKNKRIELTGPVTIICSNLTINATEFVINKGKENEDLIHIEVESLKIDYSSGQVPQLINHRDDLNNFIIISDERPAFPFGEFHVSDIESIDDSIEEKYRRLRKIILLLRSHSKGGMAKYKDAVNHKRVLRNELGRRVLDALLNKQILVSDSHLYKWNPDAAHTHLGVTYHDLKRKKSNGKVKEFLIGI